MAAGEPLAHTAGQKIDIGRMVVQAGNVFERFASGPQEGVATGHADLLERFEAVGDERRRDDEQSLPAFGGEARELEVRMRLEPGFTDQARLKGDGEAGGIETGTVRQGLRGAQALGLVAGGVRRTGRAASVGHDGAVGLG
jgi:hypothetical protein